MQARVRIPALFLALCVPLSFSAGPHLIPISTPRVGQPVLLDALPPRLLTFLHPNDVLAAAACRDAAHVKTALVRQPLHLLADRIQSHAIGFEQVILRLRIDPGRRIALAFLDRLSANRSATLVDILSASDLEVLSLRSTALPLGWTRITFPTRSKANKIIDPTEIRHLLEAHWASPKTLTQWNDWLIQRLVRLSDDPFLSFADQVCLVLARDRGANRQLVQDLAIRSLNRLITQLSEMYQSKNGLPRHVVPDLEQEARILIIQHIDRFNPFLARITSYFQEWIFHALTRKGQEHSRTVHRPSDLDAKAPEFSAAKAKLYQRFERKPTTEELAQELSWTEEQVNHFIQSTKREMSLDGPVPNSKGRKTSWTDRLSLPEENELNLHERNKARTFLLHLRPRNALVLYLRQMGWDGEEMGKLFGVSKQAIGQLERKTLEKPEILEDYLTHPTLLLNERWERWHLFAGWIDLADRLKNADISPVIEKIRSLYEKGTWPLAGVVQTALADPVPLDVVVGTIALQKAWTQIDWSGSRYEFGSQSQAVVVLKRQLEMSPYYPPDLQFLATLGRT